MRMGRLVLVVAALALAGCSDEEHAKMATKTIRFF